VEIPRKLEADTPENFRLRFFNRLKELIPLARSRLAESQARYKAGFDRKVREKNKDVSEGSCVFIRREVHEMGINPKLDDQVDGPDRVVQTDGSTFLLRIGDDHIRVSSDHVTSAPTPKGEEPHAGDRRRVDEVVQRGNRPEELPQRNDWPQGESVRNEDDTRNDQHPSGNPPEGNKPEADEFVFEKIVGTKMSKTGRFYIEFAGSGIRVKTTLGSHGHIYRSAL
jgi:hypothetical protein